MFLEGLGSQGSRWKVAEGGAPGLPAAALSDGEARGEACPSAAGRGLCHQRFCGRCGPRTVALHLHRPTLLLTPVCVSCNRPSRLVALFT